MVTQVGQISNDVRVPGFYADITSVAVPEAPPDPRTLLIGLYYSDATLDGLARIDPIPMTSAAQLVANYSGLENSPVASALAALRNNYNGDVDVLPVKIPSSAVVANAATHLRITENTDANRSDGETLILRFFIGGSPVDVQSTIDLGTASTAVLRRAAIVSGLVTAINAENKLDGIVAAAGASTRGSSISNADTLVITAGDATHRIGELGNQFSVQIIANSGNVGITNPSSAASTSDGDALMIGSFVRFAGGSGAFDIGTALAAFAEGDYDDIVIPYSSSDALNDLNSWIDTRWNWKSQKYGHGWAAVRDTQTNLKGTSYKLGHETLTIFGIDGTLVPSYVLAAAAAGAAIDSLREDPGLPLNGVPVRGITHIPGFRDRFTYDQNNDVLKNGVATFGYSGNALTIQRAVTNDSSGRWTNTERRYQAVFVARAMLNNLNLYTNRTKLVRDGTTAATVAANVVTPSGIRTRLINFYRTLEAEGHVQGSSAFAEGLQVGINPFDPSRVDIILDPDVADQLFVLAALFNYV